MNYNYAMVTGHLKWTYRCPICQRPFRGNGYYNHLKACKLKAKKTIARDARRGKL